jgi:hypothetical protein
LRLVVCPRAAVLKCFTHAIDVLRELAQHCGHADIIREQILNE